MRRPTHTRRIDNERVHRLEHCNGRAFRSESWTFGDDGSRQEEAIARSQMSMNPTADAVTNRNQRARMVGVKEIVSHRPQRRPSATALSLLRARMSSSMAAHARFHAASSSGLGGCSSATRATIPASRSGEGGGGHVPGPLARMRATTASGASPSRSMAIWCTASIRFPCRSGRNDLSSRILRLRARDTVWGAETRSRLIQLREQMLAAGGTWWPVRALCQRREGGVGIFPC